MRLRSLVQFRQFRSCSISRRAGGKGGEPGAGEAIRSEPAERAAMTREAAQIKRRKSI
jgi:hypothetical protein